MNIDVLAGEILLTFSLIAWGVYWVADYLAARRVRQIPRKNVRWTNTAR
jgi:hypothetical protein